MDMGERKHHWLIKAYRRKCLDEGLISQSWIEEVLYQIPEDVICLKLRMATANGYTDLCSMASDECQLLLDLLMTGTSEKSGVTIRALDFSGNPVGNMCIRHICQAAFQVGKRCRMQDLVLKNCNLSSVREDDDALRFLSLCRPLRRSLCRLVLSNNADLVVVNPVAWKRLLNEGRLRLLCLQDTGLQDKGLESLFEIISKSEGAASSLSVVRVGPPFDVPSCSIGTFSLIVECVRNLTSLKVLEIKGLTPGQRESLSREWSTAKGGQIVQYLSEDDNFRLSVATAEIPAERLFVGTVEAKIEKREHLVNMHRTNAAGARSGSMPRRGIVQTHIVDAYRQPKRRDRTFRIGRKQCEDRYSRSRTRHVQSSKVSATSTGQARPRVRADGRVQAERMRSSRDGYHSQYMETEEIGLSDDQEEAAMHEEEMDGSLGSDCSWPGALRRQSSHSSYCTSATSSDDSLGLESPDSFGPAHQESTKRARTTQKQRPGLVKLYKMSRTKKARIGNEQHAKRSRSRCIGTENIAPDRIDPYDPATEKMYGAPPGGRVFRLNDGNDDQDSDLQGYFSDGFIRPDEEIVYTTSASDGSVENDIDNLRNPIPVLRQVSQDADEADTMKFRSEHSQTSHSSVDLDGSSLDEPCQNRRTNNLNERQTGSHATPNSIAIPRHPGENSPPQVHSKRKKSNKISSELEKELASLQPFYYDKFREKYRPGKIFEDGGQESESKRTCSLSGTSPASGKSLLDFPEDNNAWEESQDKADAETPQPSSENAHKRMESEPLQYNAGVSTMSNVPTVIKPNEYKKKSHDIGSPSTENPTESVAKDLSRMGREAKRLSVWSWDRHFQDVPPNIEKYLPTTRIRTRSLVQRYEPEVQERSRHGLSTIRPSQSCSQADEPHFNNGRNCVPSTSNGGSEHVSRDKNNIKAAADTVGTVEACSYQTRSYDDAWDYQFSQSEENVPSCSTTPGSTDQRNSDLKVPAANQIVPACPKQHLSSAPSLQVTDEDVVPESDDNIDLECF